MRFSIGVSAFDFPSCSRRFFSDRILRSGFFESRFRFFRTLEPGVIGDVRRGVDVTLMFFPILVRGGDS